MMEEPMTIKLFDRIHEMSMSDDGWEASTGRCLKAFINEFDNWEAAEKERGTERPAVVYAIMTTCSIVAATTVLAAAKITHRKQAVERATATFSKICQELLKDAEEYTRMEGNNAE